MQIVILSDIHSNAVALDAVLNAAPTHDEVWCLGDTIGYGPQPNECLARIRQRAKHVLTGNHDLACLGEVPLDDFNPVAQIANMWNNAQLDAELRAWLRERPARLDLETATLAHASPRDPIWEYVLDRNVARANLDHFTTPVGLVGHSHVPLQYMLRADGKQLFEHIRPGQVVQLDPSSRYILNPGSVGQPRDGDARASYAVWNTEAHTIRVNRVAYDIAATQKQMRDVDLPDVLWQRLAYGR